MSLEGADLLRLRRGMVLQELHVQYPHRLVRLALERRLLPLYTDDVRAFERDLEYLAKKGLLEKHGDLVAGRTVWSFEITPAGCDLVEGSAKDPGVDCASR